MQIILASQSPRRRELFMDIVPSFTVEAADVDESIAPGTHAREAVQELSSRKAAEISARHPQALVIGADTVVALHGQILGKPVDEADAYRMLSLLSGKTHEVLTGVTITGPAGTETFCTETSVRFYPLSKEEIDAYIATGEPFDKAGAYGIQGAGRFLVEGITGDFFNVMGLPVAELSRRIKQWLE